MRRLDQLRVFRHRIRATRSGRLTLQALVGLLGGSVVVVGIILIPFPGPGWLIVLAGLAILAIEFVWAERLLAFTRVRLEWWWHWLGRQHWTVRVLAGLVGLLFVATVTGLSLHFSFGVNSIGDIWRYIVTH